MTEHELIQQEKFQLARLEKLENEIDDARRNAYFVIGSNLAEIRDNQLYKTPRHVPVAGRYSFTTWEEYVQDRWGYANKSRADQLIQVATEASKMDKILSVLPASESHVRALLKLPSDQDRANVWRQIIGTYKDGKGVTARLVSDEVEKYMAAKEKNWVTLTEWNAMNKKEREQVWDVPDTGTTFNKQDTEAIEWAQWSWNPITGCKHDCPYCYARDIANRFYPHQFEPALYPGRLHIPSNSEVPAKAETDTRYRNVFTGSMADLFGRWVPAEWIESVLDVIEQHPEWNFLTLTKFPNRISEFDIPDNAWMGTTVDMQARVANAEKAFSRIECGVRWLSVEPMLEPLVFQDIGLFDWVVIGGASKSSKTPAWHPPFQWIVDLVTQCRDAGVRVYFKTNLIDSNRRILELPFDAPIERMSEDLPKSMRYLGKS